MSVTSLSTQTEAQQLLQRLLGDCNPGEKQDIIDALYVKLGAERKKDWIRVREALEWSGLAKPTLYSLMERGLVRNTSLRERDQARGTRLVSFSSLRDYLESRAKGGLSVEAQEPAISI